MQAGLAMLNAVGKLSRPQVVVAEYESKLRFAVFIEV